MKRIIGLGLVVLVVAAIGIVVRGVTRGPGNNSPSSAEIALEDFRFVPNQLVANVGVPMTVRLTNRGLERHDINFPSLHMPGLKGVESILEPGETRTITLQFDSPGTHTFICSLPGHAAAGMTGAVLVRP
ncbi:MAG: cupredoxin domain-containing protein [Chloroflexi bacterium]|nr:cupredoxin domain-containing protein [Chloroflexota bacterium]